MSNEFGPKRIPGDIIAKNQAALNDMLDELYAPIKAVHGRAYVDRVASLVMLLDGGRKLMEMMCGEIPHEFRLLGAKKFSDAVDRALCMHIDDQFPGADDTTKLKRHTEMLTSTQQICEAIIKFEEAVRADVNKKFGTDY